MPATGGALCRPVRLTARPTPTELMSRPVVIAASISPEEVALRFCTNCSTSGTNRIAANIAAPTQNATAPVSAKVGLRNSPSGSTGSGAERCESTKAGASTAAATPEQPALRVGPADLVAARHPAQEAADRAGQQERPAQVEAVLAAPDRQWELGGDDDEHDRADRQVQQEQPAPGGVVGDRPADHRAEHAGQAEHRAEQALVAGPLPGGDDVADDGQRERQQAAAAEALQGAGRRQGAHALRGGAQRGAGQEDDDRGQEHRFAAEQVGDPAVEQRRGGRGQQVGRDHPVGVLDAAEIADDRRQRHRDHRAVEGAEQDAEHQRDQQQPEAGGGLAGS